MKQVVLWLLVFFCCVYVTQSDDRYSEGYYDYFGLPGGIGLPDTAPNLPLGTNTGRGSDGITTTSAFTTSSPRFPYYRGSQGNTSDRFMHYKRYAESAKQQGISVYGAGDQEREAARLKITALPNYQSIPPPSKTFTVHAAVRWNPSDFAIQEGEFYNITVFGDQTGYSSQFWNDGGIRVNAEGYTSYFDSISNCYVALGRCRNYLKKRRRIQVPSLHVSLFTHDARFTKLSASVT